MIILLRGHIKDSFENKKLFTFIEDISLIYPIEIYIHTWNIKQTNISWDTTRKKDLSKINNDIINFYFDKLSKYIKHIIIDDDSKIELIGNLHGKISGAPLIGWKNYWYGQNNIIDYIYKNNNNKETLVLNMRFDLFNYNKIYSNDYFNSYNIINIINNFINIKFNKNIFFHNFFSNFTDLNLGIDNIYIGNIETMNKLIKHFHKNLDEIKNKNKDICHQEHLVPFENYYLFN
jgi:hypothetical protein